MSLLKKSYKTGALLCLFPLFVGCGYRSVLSLAKEAHAVSIPFIAQDEDGLLRNCLARRLASSGCYLYDSSSSLYELVVEIKKEHTDTVGYAKPFLKETAPSSPSEAKKQIFVKVQLVDASTKKPVIEPFEVFSDVYYDFLNPTCSENIVFKDSKEKSRSILQYSLGQLSSEEEAGKEAKQALLEDLSQKIIDRLLVSTPLYTKR